jgi:hypothetical protein
MGQYIITIVPVTDDDLAGPLSQTSVRVEIDNGRSTVTELIMRAPDGSGLANGELPYVDFETLLRAFVPKAAAAEPAPRQRPARKTVPKAVPKKAAATSRSTGRTRSAKAKVTHLPAGRAYRRAPQVEELEAVYAETGSITGVAKHFGVPAHTAQGWISRLRRRNAAGSSN